MSGEPLVSRAGGKLKQIALGGQGMQTSEIGLGGMSAGVTMGSKDIYGKPSKKPQDIDDLIVKLHKEVGLTHLDSAQMYNSLSIFMCPCTEACCGYRGEQLFGAAVNKIGRENFQVVTKVIPQGAFGSKAHIKNKCDESLKYFGVDCLDLYYLHRIDQRIPIEVSMEAMNELKKEGKIKFVGLSECSSETIRRAHAVCPLTCIQMEWSLFARDMEAKSDIIQVCKELKIGIVAYSPLGRGMLTATVDVNKLGGFDWRNMSKTGYVHAPKTASHVKAFKEIAEKKGTTTAILALAWLIKHGRNLLGDAGIVPIPGSGNIDHMLENCKAADLVDQLTAEDMAAIEAAVPIEDYSNPEWRYNDADLAPKQWIYDKGGPTLEEYNNGKMTR